ncbi:CRP/FNR family transcriptional regulator [Virgibacillus natechei]|uniref:CRP/FNR family transcriptional regulator n=1 Tax=Virgibacillus natechei TaxID=1216297 RepID=A0ABS4IG16_9BACI|nr:Crp/Fnr family transcriptional regulator [Virgibacillus natechei]MBP1969895.1 CRP/FNR family transcriptional regulator [Virgibacillus natechei]UZD13439.1 Crp/Fnr family transcriptional regulator [Virgibacillus natechei]
MQASLLTKNRHEELLSNELHALLDSIGTTKKIRKDTFLFQEGMEAHDIYLVKSGLVQIGKLGEDGKELTLRICKNDDVVGELTLFSDNPIYLLNAKVLKSGEVLAINKDKLEHELMQNSALTFEFMKWVSNQMRKFQYKIRDLLLNGKKGALYSTLIRLSNSYGIEQNNGVLIDMALTNQELAAFCAATRESANRMLVDLRKQDVISMNKSGKIFIKDMQFLRDEIGCEHCPIEICNID